MDMTPDQMVEFLRGAFKDIDRETLLLLLQANRYDLDATIETLISMEEESAPSQSSQSSMIHDYPLPSQDQSSRASHRNGENMGSSNNVEQNGKRGAKVALPDNFLRIPGWNERHDAQMGTGDYVNLLSDPVFLRELEREFGPDYEAVLREHLQAEALRSLQHPPMFHPDQARDTHAQGVSNAVDSNERYRQHLPAYEQQHASLEFQQKYRQEQEGHGYSQGAPPPTTNGEPGGRRPMVGFGGGSDQSASASGRGNTITERFQNILRGFTSPPASRVNRKEDAETRGLLHEDDDDEEGQWEGRDGIQMKESYREPAEYEEEDEGSSALLQPHVGRE